MSREPNPRCPHCGASQTQDSGNAASRGGQPPTPGILLEPPTAQDPEFASQLEQLRLIELRHVAFGADLRQLWRPAIHHPGLLERLARSDELLDEIKGRRDLVARRRRGLLRHLHGPDRGMPHHFPELPAGAENSPDKEYRVLRLRDELEWIVIVFYRPTRDFPFGRPVRETLTHELARAILDWKASHLDLWLSTYPHLIGGRIYHEIPPEARVVLDSRAEARGRRIIRPREFLHEVRFSTARFMQWYYSNMN